MRYMERKEGLGGLAESGVHLKAGCGVVPHNTVDVLEV